MKKIVNAAFVFFLFLSCGKNNKSNGSFKLDTELNKVVLEFKKKKSPNCDKIILIRLYETSPKIVFEIEKVDYPHMFADDLQYFMSTDSCPVFLRSSYETLVSLPIDTSLVREVINSTYFKYLELEEYEVNFDPNDHGWFYISGENSQIFNMADSVLVYKDVESQYLKLNKLIYESSMGKK